MAYIKHLIADFDYFNTNKIHTLSSFKHWFWAPYSQVFVLLDQKLVGFLKNEISEWVKLKVFDA